MKTIYIESRRKKSTTLENLYPQAEILDLTSKGPEPWVKFSPFYPHGDIPIPLSEGHSAQSIEGIWQGLKVFEQEDIDPAKFEIRTMKGIKRTVRSKGPVRGHRAGANGNELLNYIEARIRIYLPAYLWLLENKLVEELRMLRELGQERELVFLDYETNQDLQNLVKPLSHASLVKNYLEGNWPGSR